MHGLSTSRWGETSMSQWTNWSICPLSVIRMKSEPGACRSNENVPVWRLVQRSIAKYARTQYSWGWFSNTYLQEFGAELPSGGIYGSTPRSTDLCKKGVHSTEWDPKKLYRFHNDLNIDWYKLMDVLRSRFFANLKTDCWDYLTRSWHVILQAMWSGWNDDYLLSVSGAGYEMENMQLIPILILKTEVDGNRQSVWDLKIWLMGALFVLLSGDYHPGERKWNASDFICAAKTHII